MPQEPNRIRVAISGGGLAGASLFHSLLKHPHLDVHIFESSPVFRESGAGIGLSHTAQQALKLIGPSAVQAFERAGAVPQRGAHLVLAQGPDTGETVGRIGGEHNVVGIVHRAEFLRELLADAPGDRMHASKKLQDVEQVEDGPVTLHFDDGTKHECDILIGADGIHSRVRAHVLGNSDPAVSPVPAGWWCVQVLKPYAEVASVLSKKYFDIDSPGEVGWIGDGALIFHNILSSGDLGQFVIVSYYNPAGSDEWQKTVASEDIRRIFADWPRELSNAVEKLLCDRDSHDAICFWQHLPARSYVHGSVAVTGDAAHATTPWQGAGAGMSIEDSLILSSLLGQAKSPREARLALPIYDSLRRPRTQRVVESSMGTGLMATGQNPEAGLASTRLREKFEHRWDFIMNFNLEEHQAEALRQLEAQLR